MDEKKPKILPLYYYYKSIDIDSFKSIKNSSIRGLMGSYHMGLGGYLICPEGYVMTNEEMTSLVYLSRVCSCWLFLRMGEGDGITTSTRLFLDREWENGFANPQIG
jgi:hypothetical protein